MTFKKQQFQSSSVVIFGMPNNNRSVFFTPNKIFCAGHHNYIFDQIHIA